MRAELKSVDTVLVAPNFERRDKRVMTYPDTTILFCACVNSETVDTDRRARVRAVLDCAEGQVVTVPDLCRLAADADPLLRDWVCESSHLTIVGCYPRTLRALFDAAGYPLDEERTTILNIHEKTPRDIAQALGVDPDIAEKAPAQTAGPADEEDGWVPWFPVIDRARCRDCGQCLDFCLFGVYEKTADGRITVKNPRQCKTNCPACARICPHLAIIFPKIDEVSPVKGTDMTAEEAPQGTVCLSLEELFGDDVYEKLRRRRQTRLLNRRRRGDDEQQ